MIGARFVFGSPFPRGSWREVSTEQIASAFGQSPDRSRRKDLLNTATLAGALGAFLVTAPLMVLFWWMGAYWLLRGLYVYTSAAMGWSIVFLFRYLMDNWDERRWTRAGRPPDWIPWTPAQPKRWDLVYMAFVMCGFLTMLLPPIP